MTTRFDIGDKVTWTTPQGATYTGKVSSLDGTDSALIDGDGRKRRVRVKQVDLKRCPEPAEGKIETEGPPAEGVETEAQAGEAAPDLATPTLKPPRIQWVDLDIISPNPYQPRQSMDQKALESLARGIRLKRRQLPDTGGLLQVPIGREHAGRTQLAFGHRRLSAFLLNREEHPDEDWSRMPVQILEMDDETLADYAARENADREDLNDIEKAEAIRLLMEEFEWPLKKAASAHGVSETQGSNLTRLLELPEEIQKLVIEKDENGKPLLGQTLARELVRLVQAEPPLVVKAIELGRLCTTMVIHRDALKERVTTLIEEQRVMLKTEAQINTLGCYHCGGTLRFDGTWIHCNGCSDKWVSIDNFEQAKKHRLRTETRYCRSCGEPREFTGLELDGPTGASFYCVACPWTGNAGKWRRKPLPELPTGPVIIKTGTRMFGYWSCGVCGEGQEPGQRTWVSIDGVESNCCDDCLKRLTPLATRGKIRCARCTCPSSWGFQTTRPDKGWTRAEEQGQVKYYCTDCAWRLYEDLPCPSCGGRVYYAKMLQGLECEQCERWWEFTSAFRDEATKKAGEPERVYKPLFPGGVPQEQAEQSSTPKPLTCPRCQGIVKKNPGAGLICTGCQATWGDLRTLRNEPLYGAKAADWRKQSQPAATSQPVGACPEDLVPAERVPTAAGEFDCPRCGRERVVKINGGAMCALCGVKWGKVDDFHAERLVTKDSRTKLPRAVPSVGTQAQACPKCGGFHLIHTGNLHRCGNCHHEWTTPANGSKQRREDLHRRVGRLPAIIDQCAVDALHHLENWFDTLERAFPPPPLEDWVGVGRVFPEKASSVEEPEEGVADSVLEDVDM